VRASFAWAHRREKDYPAALRQLAEALALDKTGQYRETLPGSATMSIAFRHFVSAPNGWRYNEEHSPVMIRLFPVWRGG
jgi:hypothetical protein